MINSTQTILKQARNQIKYAHLHIINAQQTTEQPQLPLNQSQTQLKAPQYKLYASQTQL